MELVLRSFLTSTFVFCFSPWYVDYIHKVACFCVVPASSQKELAQGVGLWPQTSPLVSAIKNRTLWVVPRPLLILGVVDRIHAWVMFPSRVGSNSVKHMALTRPHPHPLSRRKPGKA